MKAIILAAGRGSRMGSKTQNFPKCFIKIFNKKLIEHQIDNLKNNGIIDIAIVTGYKSEFLKKYGSKHFYNPNWNTTGILNSLLCASSWLKKYDCIVSYSDIFFKKKIINDLICDKNPISIAYDPNWKNLWKKRFENPLDDAEKFKIDKNNFIQDIGGKSSKIENIEGQYMGLLKFQANSLNIFLKKEKKLNFTKMDMTTLLKEMILKKVKVKGIKNTQRWFEFDSVKDLSLISK